MRQHSTSNTIFCWWILRIHKRWSVRANCAAAQTPYPHKSHQECFVLRYFRGTKQLLLLFILYITRHCFLAFETLPNDELLYIIIHITLTNIHSPISQSFSLLLYPNLMCFSCEYEKWPQLTVNQNAMLNLNKWMNKWKITELLTRELIRWNKKLYKNKKNGTEKCLHVQHAHFRINRINLAATLERRFYSMHK